MRRFAPVLLVSLALAACGSDSEGGRGGRVPGDILTVHSALPLRGPARAAARDMVDGQKLALAEVRGQVGRHKVAFAAAHQPDGPGGRVRGGRVAAIAREAIADEGIVAYVGDLQAAAAWVTAPLFNAAGLLHVSPGVTDARLTRPSPAGGPAPGRARPAGDVTFARVVGSDVDQARVLARAARRAAAGRGVAVLHDGGGAARALAALVARRLARRTPPARAAAVVYAGTDPVRAARRLRRLRAAAVVVPDALARTDLPRRLGPRRARRVLLVSAAPPPGSSRALRRFERSFRARLGRRPGPYAALGYEAMSAVLAAIRAAGPRAASRQRVVDAFLELERRGSVLGPYAVTRSGDPVPGRFHVYRERLPGPEPRRGGR